MPKVLELGHVGLFITDPEVMTDFYSRFLGMTITDRDGDRRIFLSARPESEHHELLLAKDPSRHSDLQQLSFRGRFPE